jgi:hypothetical protein
MGIERVYSTSTRMTIQEGQALAAFARKCDMSISKVIRTAVKNMMAAAAADEKRDATAA